MIHFRTILVVGAIFAVFANLAEAEDMYPSTFDHLDIETILNDEPQRARYYDCFMDEGPCDLEGAEFFKGIFPEIISTLCAKCSPRQKEMLEIFTTWYTVHRPDLWQKMVTKIVNDLSASSSKIA